MHISVFSLRFRLVVSFIVIFLVGFFVGYVFLKKMNVDPIVKGCKNNFHYINASLNCSAANRISKEEYTEFSYNLRLYIESQIKDKNINNASVYFRDLSLGPTFGYNEQAVFIPASLLKVPLLITYLNLADDKPDLLSKRTAYSKVNNEVAQTLEGVEPLRPKTFYKIEDLLKRMIIYSDNLSYGLLVSYLKKAYPDRDYFAETMKELALVNPRNPAENTITAKSYLSLFRQLYNGTYLSLEKSEIALGYLSQTTFKEGLAAGVPSHVEVAHKFGERGGLKDGYRQIHDCGIIYYPNNPYLLCIMTFGSNKEKLINVIKEISGKVYQEVDSRKY